MRFDLWIFVLKLLKLETDKVKIFGGAEVVPISTFTDLGEREFLVADERGYDCLLYKMAEDFLFTEEGIILDTRLKLNQVLFPVIMRNLNRLSILTCVILLDFSFYFWSNS